MITSTHIEDTTARLTNFIETALTLSLAQDGDKKLLADEMHTFHEKMRMKLSGELASDGLLDAQTAFRTAMRDLKTVADWAAEWAAGDDDARRDVIAGLMKIQNSI